MLFNSYIFIFAFLPCMLVGYYILKHQAYFRLSKIFLVAGSLFFYGYWNPSYVPILLSSLAINFLFAQKLVSLTLEGGGAQKILADWWDCFQSRFIGGF